MSFSDPPLSPADELRTGISRPMLAGALALVALLALLVLWAAFTVIGGAVIASGQAVVRGQPQRVQSLDGGIVAAIHVRNGDHVTEGEVLLRLDPTLLEVNLEVAMSRLAEALALRARLESEQAGLLAAPDFTYAPLPFPLPDTSRPELGQRQIFIARAELLEGQQAQGTERIAQIGNQITGASAQIAAKQDQLSYLDRELTNVRRLSELGLARESQLLELQRSRADMLGQIAALEADVARLTNAIRDSEIEASQAVRQFHEEVVTELRSVTAEIAELVPQIVTTRTQLARVDLRAPVAGVVHEMQAATIGGVIAPGAVILEVIPVEQGVDFELRLDPRYIDQVWPGQNAQLSFAALDPREAPRIAGAVTTVSPGLVTDPATGAGFYRVGIAIPPTEIARLGKVALVPGMPVEAFLETGERAVLSYLLDPLGRHIARAFRER